MSKSLPLVEKFRPKTFDEVVGVEHLSKLTELIKTPMDMPNLLFWGPVGTGKTTCVKIILDRLTPVDVLKLNGSSKQDRNIETFSKRVLDFASSKSSVEGKPKIIFIDEIDNGTIDGFLSLRGTIEKVVKNARFIGTCNFLAKIPEPIQSRFTLFEFKKAKPEEILPRIKYICEQEGIKATDETLTYLIKKNNGDIRGIINELQQLSSNEGKEITNVMSLMSQNLAEEVFELINKGNWFKIRYEIPLKNPDYNKLLVDLDDLFFKSDKDIQIKMKINEIISSGLSEMSLSFDKSICFSSVCSKIIGVLK